MYRLFISIYCPVKYTIKPSAWTGKAIFLVRAFDLNFDTYLQFWLKSHITNFLPLASCIFELSSLQTHIYKHIRRDIFRLTELVYKFSPVCNFGVRCHLSNVIPLARCVFELSGLHTRRQTANWQILYKCWYKSKIFVKAIYAILSLYILAFFELSRHTKIDRQTYKHKSKKSFSRTQGGLKREINRGCSPLHAISIPNFLTIRTLFYTLYMRMQKCRIQKYIKHATRYRTHNNVQGRTKEYACNRYNEVQYFIKKYR